MRLCDACLQRIHQAGRCCPAWLGLCRQGYACSAHILPLALDSHALLYSPRPYLQPAQPTVQKIKLYYESMMR